jgi:hypothetical protein
MKIFLLLATTILVGLNFFEKDYIIYNTKKYEWEAFSPTMAIELNSTDKIQHYIDAIATEKKVDKNALAYINIIAATLRERFYHGYSYYNCKQNWMAFIAGKIIWQDVAAIVIPNDILQYPMAACSQQELVFIQLLKNNHIDYRKVIFKHHFALEALVNGKWYFFDTNLEPKFVNNNRESLQNIIIKNQLDTIYSGRILSSSIDSMLGSPTYGKVNEFPAKNALLFQQVTKFLSNWLWIIPFLLWCRMQFFSKKMVG